MSSSLDGVRARALQQIEREERTARAVVVGFLIGVALLEAAGIVALLLTLDFKDPLHRLLGLMTAFIYLTLTGWIIVVWAQVRLSTERILKAIASAPTHDDP